MASILGYITTPICVVTSLFIRTPTDLYEWSVLLLALLTVFSVVSYIVPNLLTSLMAEQNLKKKYNAKWAIVTGGSSGLGRSIVDKLCKQGLNVVVVALEDPLLTQTRDELIATYPELEFRMVGVDMTKHDECYDYMQVIEEATNDIDIQVIFSNAGFAGLKAFPCMSARQADGNLECNLVSHSRFVRAYMQKLVAKKLKGCICITSSQVGFFPAAFAALYSSEKAFLMSMGACLFVEGKIYGIDVLAGVLGPMRTRFSSKLPQIDFVKFFQQLESDPEGCASELLKSIGRVAWRDIGAYTYVTRLILRFLDMNVFMHIQALAFPLTPDFRQHPELWKWDLQKQAKAK
mmetsp:Transcript_11919/g.13124  ORF Transcript_11919/g.13124 Transcript_11919/m.13124 type:complete len:348 (+) Transcript_11919:34-1077(+)|eukprot:CAMPEP_0168517584 /NCGR_PEP_ID=MMETSP0405-20121227/6137_1 /TAXON_ID=498012 /ORGANISM="Trichosphaerium sp, Strain Am-I-7 wt" /LENGTH=347 /DNA_ID=CAMNT_0008537619 /DNA_START=217 /DNA_END=1260 /DNA_ORIENTATION=-